jgi:hypothetical protein
MEERIMSRKIPVDIFLFVMISMSSACATYYAPGYGISTMNVDTLEQKMGGTDVKVKLNEFTAVPTVDQDMWCRGAGPVMATRGQTFHKYIQDALQDEFSAAKIYSPDAQVTIDGVLQKIDFDSWGTSSWDIELTLFSSTGTSFTVAEHFEFSGACQAKLACEGVAKAFPAAVQSLIEKIITHPEFDNLIGM